jgi:hypothetical protein
MVFKFTNFALLALFCLSLNNVSAQEKEEAKTLVQEIKPIKTEDIGFFIAPSYGLTQMDRSTTSLFNLRGGLTLKDKFSLGAYFSSSLNQIKPQSETIQNIYMDYWTVGGFVEYTLFSKKLVHLTFPLYIGYGEVQMDNEKDDTDLGEANFFQIEPSMLLEVNIHKNVRFNIGTGYRILSDMSYRNFNQTNITGLTAYMGLKFGLW